MNSEPFLLDGPQRTKVEKAVREVCSFREYRMIAINVRTNHAHVVVWAAASPNIIMTAFKANATRELRESGLVSPDQPIWWRGGSTRYLWKPDQLEAAVDYTLNGQGSDLPDF